MLFVPEYGREGVSIGYHLEITVLDYNSQNLPPANKANWKVQLIVQSLQSPTSRCSTSLYVVVHSSMEALDVLVCTGPVLHLPPGTQHEQVTLEWMGVQASDPLNGLLAPFFFLMPDSDIPFGATQRRKGREEGLWKDSSGFPRYLPLTQEEQRKTPSLIPCA